MKAIIENHPRLADAVVVTVTKTNGDFVEEHVFLDCDISDAYQKALVYVNENTSIYHVKNKRAIYV
jgi:bacterioferritin (cytochrome b1)